MYIYLYIPVSLFSIVTNPPAASLFFLFHPLLVRKKRKRFAPAVFRVVTSNSGPQDPEERIEFYSTCNV